LPVATTDWMALRCSTGRRRSRRAARPPAACPRARHPRGAIVVAEVRVRDVQAGVDDADKGAGARGAGPLVVGALPHHVRADGQHARVMDQPQRARGLPRTTARSGSRLSAPSGMRTTAMPPTTLPISAPAARSTSSAAVWPAEGNSMKAATRVRPAASVSSDSIPPNGRSSAGLFRPDGAIRSDIGPHLRLGEPDEQRVDDGLLAQGREPCGQQHDGEQASAAHGAAAASGFRGQDQTSMSGSIQSCLPCRTS
jgi:hypothetical protein